MEAILRAHVKINMHIKFLNLVPYLNRYKIFTSDETTHFINDPKEVSVNNLINWLSGKADEGIFNFVKALNEATEHSGHKQILQAIRAVVHDNEIYTYDE